MQFGDCRSPKRRGGFCHIAEAAHRLRARETGGTRSSQPFPPSTFSNSFRAEAHWRVGANQRSTSCRCAVLRSSTFRKSPLPHQVNATRSLLTTELHQCLNTSFHKLPASETASHDACARRLQSSVQSNLTKFASTK